MGEVEKLNNAFLQEVVQLFDDSMEWTDNQLSILDVFADKKIISWEKPRMELLSISKLRIEYSNTWLKIMAISFL